MLSRLRILAVVAMLTGLTVAGAASATASVGSDSIEWQPLLSADGLARLLEERELRLIDIRARDAYTQGHLPGAVAAPYGEWRGPADNPGRLPGEEALNSLVAGLGIRETTPVVVIYQGDNPSEFGAAARVYWTLKSLGVERLAILNGGQRAWEEAGLPLSTEAREVSPSDFAGTFSDRWRITSEELDTAIREGEGLHLVDARPEPFFLGKLWHDAARRPGTLPDADNLPHDIWFEDGTAALRSPEAVRRIARESGLDAGAAAVSFCNTGHWAATNWFAMSEVAGLEEVRLYAESMVEWSQADRAMANVPGRLQWLWMSTRNWIDDVL